MDNLTILGVKVSPTNALTLAMIGSAIAIIMALSGQYFGGLLPCELCLWQRVPYVVAIVGSFSGLFLLKAQRAKAIVSCFLAAVFTVGGVIALYHTGIEQGWLPGPASCTVDPAVHRHNTIEELYNDIINAPINRCDEISWSIYGISIATWNAVFSLLLSAICAIGGLPRLKGKLNEQ